MKGAPARKPKKGKGLRAQAAAEMIRAMWPSRSEPTGTVRGGGGLKWWCKLYRSLTEAPDV